MTLRSWSMVIAFIAVIMLVLRWLYFEILFGDPLYGPNGLLAMQKRVWEEYAVASSALDSGRYKDAETHFQSALKSIRNTEALTRQHGWHAGLPIEGVLMGLADSLVQQGRLDEAEQLLREEAAKALNNRSHRLEGILRRKAEAIKTQGRKET